VGTSWDDDNGADSGSAYVFRWDGSSWVEEQKLLASDSTEHDYFGDSVSISGDVALVGALDYDDFSGSAYVFRWDGVGWVEEQKLLASDGTALDHFGGSVSISEDAALVGAYGDYHNGVAYSGSAYVFRWDGSSWVEEQKLLTSDGATYDFIKGSYGNHFGGSVSISGDVALVGATFDDDNGAYSGSAYVFKITQPDIEANDSDGRDDSGDNWFG
jgi:hypothetical protein